MFCEEIRHGPCWESSTRINPLSINNREILSLPPFSRAEHRNKEVKWLVFGHKESQDSNPGSWVQGLTLSLPPAPGTHLRGSAHAAYLWCWPAHPWTRSVLCHCGPRNWRSPSLWDLEWKDTSETVARKRKALYQDSAVSALVFLGSLLHAKNMKLILKMCWW